MQLTQDEITRLSPDERLSLIAQLWDSLEDHQVQLTPAQQADSSAAWRRWVTAAAKASPGKPSKPNSSSVAPSVAGSSYGSGAR